MEPSPSFGAGLRFTILLSLRSALRVDLCEHLQEPVEATELADIAASVESETFGHAVRLGSRLPTTTEEAQYAIDFPVAILRARAAPRTLT
jgi:hypothetical protein